MDQNYKLSSDADDDGEDDGDDDGEDDDDDDDDGEDYIDDLDDISYHQLCIQASSNPSALPSHFPFPLFAL